jgi:hypothetical protein
MEMDMKTICVLLLAMLSFGCGYSTPMAAPAQPGFVPAIAQIVPNTASAGGQGFMLTVNGSTFNANAVVNWNGTAQTTSHPATNQLTVAVPASAIATAGTVMVTVTNPGSSTPGGPYGGGGGGTMAETSTSVPFTIN